MVASIDDVAYSIVKFAALYSVLATNMLQIAFTVSIMLSVLSVLPVLYEVHTGVVSHNRVVR